MKVKSNQQGVCPKCNGKNLDHECLQLVGDMMYYPWKCLDCSQQGEEWYRVEFAGHSIYENNELVEIEHHMIEEI